MTMHPPIGPQNHKEILLDIASNLIQISRWTLKGFHEQQTNIALYLKLTRKNVEALSGRDLGKDFDTALQHFSSSYTKLEKEYTAGISDHRVWANNLKELAQELMKYAA